MRITREDLDKARQVKAILDNQYQKHYTIDELVQLFSTNREKIQFAFKAITAVNIYEYLTKVRIEKSKFLLETTYLSVDVIANKVGLAKSNFIKQFKKLSGKTPAAWRKESNSGLDDNLLFGKSSD